MIPSHEKIRMVIIDDSEITAEALTQLCREAPDLEVVAVAHSGRQGIEDVMRHKPDLVTLDIGLPDMEGFEVVEYVMAERPVPILILTATLHPTTRREAFHALTLGAVDVLEKPAAAMLNDRAWRHDFHERLRFIAKTPVVPHVLGKLKRRRAAGVATAAPLAQAAASVVTAATAATTSTIAHAPATATATATTAAATVTTESATSATSTRKSADDVPLVKPRVPLELITIVGSAGSAKAAISLLKESCVRGPMPVPVLVGIHTDLEMGKALGDYLGRLLGLPVEMAVDGCRLEPGVIYVAPGRRHTELTAKGRLHVFEDSQASLYTPSLEILLRSVVAHYGPAAAGVILSGMGEDGTRALLELRRRGGVTLGQDEQSSGVYGMPGVAFAIGAVAVQLAPDEMGRCLRSWVSSGRESASGLGCLAGRGS